MAYPHMASLRSCPMIDLDQNDVHTGEAYQTPSKPRSRARRRWGGRVFAFGAFLLLTTGISLGASRHHAQQRQALLTADETRRFAPSVLVAPVEASAAVVAVTLPGTTAAFAAANVYARATGYISRRNIDIGDHVKQGELLAELAVPELDEQISQNEATLEQLKAAVQKAEANATLAQATWGRDKPLLKDGWGTGHQGDIDLQTVKADEAAVTVAQANVVAQERLLGVLRQNRAYAMVVAPFDGVITQRNVDVGALVQGNANTGTFMFEIMQKDVIRVWVYVPQDAAFGVVPGIEAVVRVPELPDREFCRHRHPDRRCVAGGHADAADRDRHPQSRRRPDGRDLLRGRTPDPAQDAEPFGAGRCDHLQP